MKKRISNLIFIIIFLSGLSLLLYPFISDKWNTYRQNQLITKYDQMLTEQKENIDYGEEWKKAYEYNEILAPYVVPDSFAIAAAAEEPDEAYHSCLNLAGDGMMGYIEVPKLSIKVPLYHTTDDEILETAAGHLEGSSLPVGGEGSHTVVSAHRGLPSAELFTDLDQLVEGDHFLFYILDEILCYKVDQIVVVEPQDTEAMAVVEGEDLATLFTCTPYGVNSHRLLVRGHRVPYEPEVVIQEEKTMMDISIHTDHLMWVVIGLVVTGTVIGILIWREKKLRKRDQNETEN